MAMRDDERDGIKTALNSVLTPPTSSTSVVIPDVANKELDTYIESNWEKSIVETQNSKSNLNEDFDLRVPENVLDTAYLFDNIFLPDNTELNPEAKGIDFDEKLNVVEETFKNLFKEEDINDIPMSPVPQVNTVEEKKDFVNDNKMILGLGVAGLILFMVMKG